MGEERMSDEAPTADLTQRILRDIQRDLADMRDDRTVIVAILNRLDASVTSLSAKVRALRSQFDRFRNEIRERLPEHS
jgi:flagellin-like hook-associated protein FlgL